MPIEQVSRELERIVSMDQPIEELATGFGNENGPAEGPVWWKEGGYLLFSDIGNNRRMKWSSDGEVTVFQEATNFANGLTRWTNPLLPGTRSQQPTLSVLYPLFTLAS